jgi:GT2 family glycosyltransferase
MMKIGVVIPVVNLWTAYTKPCLDSVQSKENELVVYLIDNASDDATQEQAMKLVARKSKNYVLNYQRNEERWSVAKSWNWGIKQAFMDGCNYVLVVNNDTVLHPECIDWLAGKFQALEVMAAVTDSKQDVGLISAVNVSSDMDINAMLAVNPTDRKDIAFVDPPDYSCFMISRTCWEQVGEFDEEFKPAYFEDIDYRYRMKLLDIKAFGLPMAMYYHYGSRTQNEALGNQKMVPSPAFELNRSYFIRKWGGDAGAEQFTVPFNGVP